jgi:tetrahydromethanopterin S-methyltransferase subunit F
MPRSVQFSTFTTRTPRPRINTNRTHPYQDASTRPNPSRKASTPCRYFLSGQCFANDTCRYQHVLAPPTQVTEELDRQLLAFISEDNSALPNDSEAAQASADESSPFSALTPSALPVEDSVLEHEELSDEEELYEILHHPDTCVAEVRYHSTLQSRTYFVAQRQAVVGYEGNNVGVLSGGVLLGVPGALQQGESAATKAAEGDTSDAIYEYEATSSSSPSSVSNGSDVELWRGPVNFDDATVADRLVWADEDYTQAPMEDIEPTFCSHAPLLVLPTPPPVIRRITRYSEGHNRRHSLA